MRAVALAFLLVACTRPAPVAPTYLVKSEPVAAPAPEPPKPENLVCKAFARVNAEAKCEPIYTDEGATRVHSATVTLGGQQLACRTELAMLGVLCTEPIALKLSNPAPVQDAPATHANGKPAGKVTTAKGGKK